MGNSNKREMQNGTKLHQEKNTGQTKNAFQMQIIPCSSRWSSSAQHAPVSDKIPTFVGSSQQGSEVIYLLYDNSLVTSEI